MSIENVNVLKKFEYEFIKGNLDAVHECLHDDVVVHEASTLPYAGDHIGREAFMALVDTFSVTWEFVGEFDFTFIDTGDDGVVVRVEVDARARATGTPVHLRIAEFYTLRDGRIADVTVFYWDTAEMLRALGSPVDG